MKILSVANSDTEMLENINQIYLENNGIELDPTYSKGVFYKRFKNPKIKTDLYPITKDTIQMDSRKLEFNNDSIKSIMFDPPFLFRNQKSDNNDKMCNRFSSFKTFQEMLNMYNDSLKEFYRVIKKNGTLIFKCQDMTGGSGSKPFFCSHNKIINMAEEIGFILKDIGITVSKRRIIRDAKEQGCFRKIHCYFLIFKKCKKHNFKDSGEFANVGFDESEDKNGK